MNNFYIIVQMINENNKKHAYTIKVNESDNLLSKLNNKNIVSVNICESKKRAERIVKTLNEDFMKNGEQLFEEIF